MSKQFLGMSFEELERVDRKALDSNGKRAHTAALKKARKAQNTSARQTKRGRSGTTSAPPSSFSKKSKIASVATTTSTPRPPSLPLDGFEGVTGLLLSPLGSMSSASATTVPEPGKASKKTTTRKPRTGDEDNILESADEGSDVDDDDEDEDLIAAQKEPSHFEKSVVLERPQWLMPSSQNTVGNDDYSNSPPPLVNSSQVYVRPISASPSYSIPEESSNMLRSMPFHASNHGTVHTSGTPLDMSAISGMSTQSSSIHAHSTSFNTSSIPYQFPSSSLRDDVITVPSLFPSQPLPPPSTAASMLPIPSADPIESKPDVSQLSSSDTWPLETNIVRPEASGARPNVNAQHRRVKAVIKGSYIHISRSIMLENAFPENTAAVASTALLASAGSFDRVILERMNKDSAYLSFCATFGIAYISYLRKLFKVESEILVPGIYGLPDPKEKPEEYISKATKLREKFLYIFPISEGGSPNRAEPFQNVVASSILQSILKKPSFMRHRDEFRCVVNPVTGIREFEVTIPLLALAFSAVYSSFDLGIARAQNVRPGLMPEFSSDGYTDVYTNLVDQIKSIAEHKGDDALHRSLHKVYQRVPRVNYAIYRNQEDSVPHPYYHITHSNVWSTHIPVLLYVVQFNRFRIIPQMQCTESVQNGRSKGSSKRILVADIWA
ncbi:hypothetical protein K488DRAFT_74622 [Vararia minispora EC-137]|uniref:Uncharacterized protein n=1 Tax=Vararia minispora EC-137 TaxID=1314806 RepID=A0ACB8Q6Q4_9AGAM|nr:hypothetical protein K488DRAFT_74622 [Vararia minispora EC-137]